MSDPRDELRQRLQTLQAAYTAQLPARLDGIGRQWRDLQRGWDRTLAAELHRAVHGLSGSGATFGYAQLGAQAREIEIELKDWLHQEHPPRPERWRWLDDQLRALCDGAATPAATAPAYEPAAAPAATAQESPLIYLLEDDPAVACELALHLAHFNYAVTQFRHIRDLDAALDRQLPSAVIADIMLEEGELAGIEAVGALRARHTAPPPVIFLSSRDDFASRLSAVRAGGLAYSTKPVDIPRIVDRLDLLTHRRDPEPYRILVVDDDAALAARYALLLRQAGMRVTTCGEPAQVLEALIDSQPELILMDVYMPGCSGLELAQLIRQQETFLGIPIVFLSTETDLDKQLAALRMGGDDFLTKPIADEALVSSVGIRAERARTLGQLIDKDSLTGLLKHTKIKDALASELVRARRQHTGLVFAMLDIDHFKQVNDRYGHLAGDRVIKSLAHLLQQRLRHTDLIGRYGGEEFAIVLPQCDSAEAAGILDEIRQHFQALRFRHGDEEYSVSFSGGLAACPPFRNAQHLIQTADEALYASKRQGRNRITVAQAVDGNG